MATTPGPRARTPLHHWHEAHAARWTDVAGWRVPAAYGDVAQECAAARAGFAVADLGAFPLRDLVGLHTAAVAGDRALTDELAEGCASIGLAGPHVEAVLRRLTPFDVSAAAFPAGACVATGVAGVPALLARLPAAPLPAVVLCVGWDVAEYVWERLLDGGRDLGALPIGLEAWRALAGGAPPG
jgi:heterotetrameric sarcosine oxidase gamma subunit